MQTVRTRSVSRPASADAAEVSSGPSPGAGEAEVPGAQAPKVARLARGLGEWATQQVMHENAHLRAQVARLQADATWAETRFRLSRLGTPTDPLNGVCMVQDFDVTAGGFPHQYMECAEGDGVAEATRFVSARKMLRISGRLLSTLGEAGGGGGAPAVPFARTTPVNASIFGSDGVLYTISFIDASSGDSYTLKHYPGIENGVPFLEWPNGDRARDHFCIGPNESAWTVRFRFPHVCRDRKDRVEWRLRFAPKDEATRGQYPALTFETAAFRACARVKDE